MGINVAPAGEKFSVSITFAANDGQTYIDRVKEFALDAAITTAAAANTAVAALITDLLLVSKADIVAWTLHSEHKGDAGDVVAVGNPYKEASLTLNLVGGKRGNHTILAPVDTMVSGRNIVEGLAALTGYLDNFEETAGDFTISDGDYVVTANQIASSKLKSNTSGQQFG